MKFLIISSDLMSLVLLGEAMKKAWPDVIFDSYIESDLSSKVRKGDVYEGAVLDFHLQNLEQTDVLSSLEALIPDTRFVCLYDAKECVGCDAIFSSQQHFAVDRNLEFSKLLSILNDYISLSSRNKLLS